MDRVVAVAKTVDSETEDCVERFLIFYIWPDLSLASAITLVRGSWALLLGLSNSWVSSFPNSLFRSGYSSGRVSRTDGCQVW
jgi:hypothetical protein